MQLSGILETNHIRGVEYGINFFHDTVTGSAKSADNSFGVYSNNSFHNVENAVTVNANWGAAGDAATPWFIGNVFRGNFVNGIVTIGTNSSTASAFYFVTNTDPSGGGQNRSQLLMNVFDSNIVTDAGIGFLFTATSSDHYGGVVDTILWNNITLLGGAQPGSGAVPAAYGILVGDAQYPTDSDGSIYWYDVDNFWQGYYQIHSTYSS